MKKLVLQNTNSLLKLSTVEFRTGLSRSTIYRKITEGTFPKQVLIGNKSVAWPSCEIDALVQARVSARTDKEIKKLVSELHEKRNETVTLS